MLKEIHKLVDEYGLVVPMERNTPLFRARHSWNLDEVYRSAEDLGAPSSEKATAEEPRRPKGSSASPVI